MYKQVKPKYNGIYAVTSIKPKAYIMKPLQKITTLLVVLVVMWGCQRSAPEKSSTQENKNFSEERVDDMADVAEMGNSSQPSFNAPNNSIQRMGLNDSTRKFAIKGELKYRVGDVVQATYAIENQTVNVGGFVIHTEMRSNESYRLQTQISADTAMDEIHYSLTNTMQVRVPKNQLDTFLWQIGQLAEYFDYRILDANDVGLGLLKNTLQQKRLQAYEKKQEQAIENKESKLDETIDAQENLLNRQLQADEMAIDRLITLDEVKYSTIAINIYENEKVQYARVPKVKSIVPFEPSFGSKLARAFENSIDVLQSIVLFLINIWPILALLAAGIFIYLRRKKQAIVK